MIAPTPTNAAAPTEQTKVPDHQAGAFFFWLFVKIPSKSGALLIIKIQKPIRLNIQRFRNFK